MKRRFCSVFAVVSVVLVCLGGLSVSVADDYPACYKYKWGNIGPLTSANLGWSQTRGLVRGDWVEYYEYSCIEGQLHWRCVPLGQTGLHDNPVRQRGPGVTTTTVRSFLFCSAPSTRTAMTLPLFPLTVTSSLQLCSVSAAVMPEARFLRVSHKMGYGRNAPGPERCSFDY